MPHETLENHSASPAIPIPSTNKSGIPNTVSISDVTVLPVVFCANVDTFENLLIRISDWQLLASNWISDLRSPRSGWTGTLPAHYGSSPQVKLSWGDAKMQFLDAKTKGTTKAKQRETRLLLSRVLWFFQLELGPDLLGEKMHIKQWKEALTIKADGPGAVLVRVMYWVMARMRDIEFKTLDRANPVARQVFWLQNLDAVAIIYMLAYLRDAIDFEWLFDAAGLLNANNTSSHFKSKLFSLEDRKLAQDILYMVLVRLAFAAEVVFVYMIDGQRQLFDKVKFPANYKSIPAVAQIWKECVGSFEHTRAEFGSLVHIPLEGWPVKVSYDEKVAMYETKFMSGAE